MVAQWPCPKSCQPALTCQVCTVSLQRPSGGRAWSLVLSALPTPQQAGQPWGGRGAEMMCHTLRATPPRMLGSCLDFRLRAGPPLPLLTAPQLSEGTAKSRSLSGQWVVALLWQGVDQFRGPGVLPEKWVTRSHWKCLHRAPSCHVANERTRTGSKAVPAWPGAPSCEHCTLTTILAAQTSVPSHREGGPCAWLHSWGTQQLVPHSAKRGALGPYLDGGHESEIANEDDAQLCGHVLHDGPALAAETCRRQGHGAST